MTGNPSLLMMPDGDIPEEADFEAGDVFKTYEAAIRAAHERVAPDRALVPWILLGGKILEPAQIMAVNTPPAPLKSQSGSQEAKGLDDDLEDTFPASDPPARIQP